MRDVFVSASDLEMLRRKFQHYANMYVLTDAMAVNYATKLLRIFTAQDEVNLELVKRIIAIDVVRQPSPPAGTESFLND